jgi:hypothetical protein
LKKAAYELRHAVRDRLFANNQPAAVNLRYASYQREVRHNWKPNGIAPSEEAAARQFEQNGHLVKAPSPTFSDEIGAKVDTLFSDPANCYPLTVGMSRLIDGIEHVPEIMNAIDPEMERILESYYRSHFKIFGVYFYRTVPTPSKPQSSFLWHLDNCPDPEIKLMVYLDSVTSNTGALRLKNKSLSNGLRANGFRNRNNVDHLQSDLDADQTTELIEGPAGTRILFENGKVIHKATSPLSSHRDVATMVIIPSDIHWRVHFARNRHLLSTNAGACTDPRRDTAEHVGYQY